MARGWVKPRWGPRRCRNGGYPYCNEGVNLNMFPVRFDQPHADAEDAQAVAEITDSAYTTPKDLTLQLATIDERGDLIAMRSMALGSGKLALAASATAAALTVTLVVIATDGQRGATPGPNAAERLSVTEYQEKLREQCRDAENKLQIEQQAHPTATPLEELAKVRSEQLDRLRELNPPAEMATTHLEMVASLQARITLIQQADDAKSDKEIDERLGQADALAVKINDAFRILGVPECVT